MSYVLWKEFMAVDPKAPKWFNRDRFVLSAGHGSMLNYSLLHLMGYESVGVSPTTAPRAAATAAVAAPVLLPRLPRHTNCPSPLLSPPADRLRT